MKLNQTQKTIILIATFCVVAMALYPPWVLSSKYIGNITTRPGPYSFIWLPPQNDARFIDLYRLSVQFLAVLVIAIGLCLVCHTKKQ